MQPHLSGDNFLLGLARIALTFVTFASIVNIFGRGETHKNHLDRGLKFMFEVAIAATLFALLPFPLSYTLGNEREPVVWAIAEGLLSCYLASALWRHTRNYRRTKPAPPHPTLFRWTFVLPTALILILEAVSAVCRPSLAAYSWGLFWLLIPPIVQFALFVRRSGLESNA
jgi:hypothetical protein